jgi:hypothetical protein
MVRRKHRFIEKDLDRHVIDADRRTDGQADTGTWLNLCDSLPLPCVPLGNSARNMSNSNASRSPLNCPTPMYPEWAFDILHRNAACTRRDGLTCETCASTTQRRERTDAEFVCALRMNQTTCLLDAFAHRIEHVRHPTMQQVHVILLQPRV